MAVITAVVRSLVDYPEEVKVTVVSGSCVLFSISVDTRDLAKVIGKKGNKIISLRNIISGVGAKHRRRTIVEVIQDGWHGAPEGDRG